MFFEKFKLIFLLNTLRKMSNYVTYNEVFMVIRNQHFDKNIIFVISLQLIAERSRYLDFS